MVQRVRFAWLALSSAFIAASAAACAGKITITELDEGAEASVSSVPDATSSTDASSTSDVRANEAGDRKADTTPPPPPHVCDTTLGPLAAPGNASVPASGSTDLDSASCEPEAKGPETVYQLTLTSRTGVIFDAEGTGSTPVLSIRDTCKMDSSDNGRCGHAAAGVGKLVLRSVLEPGTYFVVADQQLTSGQSAPYTLTTTTFTPAANNTCVSAVAITQPDAGPATFTADTNAGLVDTTPCNSFNAGRLYYAVTLKPGQKCTATITPQAGATWRAAVAAFADCSATACTANQVAAADGQPVTVTLQNDWSQPQKTFVVAVNATDPNVGGPFTLSATYAALPKCAVNTPNGTQCGGAGVQSHCCGSTASVEGTCKANTDVTSCGNTCTTCPARANATATCNGTACGFTCLPGFADCDGNAANGCEVNTKTDKNNCGACTKLPTTDKRCTSADPNADPKCTNGVCDNPPACKAPYARCGGSTCSVNLNTSTSHCLQCNNSCARANATGATCTAGGCGGWTCSPGFGNCTGGVNGGWDDGCETITDADNFNCGTCGTACYADFASGVCTGGTCQGWTCDPGTCPTAGSPANGCGPQSDSKCGPNCATCRSWFQEHCSPTGQCCGQQGCCILKSDQTCQ